MASPNEPPSKLLDIDVLRGADYAVTFRRLSWAFLFLINVPLYFGPELRYQFDLLPDVICWVLLLGNLENILTLDERARSLQPVVGSLALLSLMALFLGFTGVHLPRAPGILVVLTIMLLSVIAIWWLMSMIADLSGFLGHLDVRRRAIAARLSFLVLQVVYALMLFSLTGRADPFDRLLVDPAFALLLSLVHVAVVVFIMIVLRGAVGVCRMGSIRR